jgi:LacI family transcriptional regulator
MASIKEIAAEAGVSQATVSKVLNDRFHTRIPATTRDRVRSAATRLGYHPSALARGLAGKRMNALGVVMAYDQISVTGDPYLGPCLDGILQGCKAHRQRAVVVTEGRWEDALDQLPYYCDGHCDGLLLVIPRLDSAIVGELQSRRTPFALIGDSRDSESLARVDVANRDGAREVVRHLIERGHRRIAAFLGNEDFCSNGQRLRGYQEAMTEAGLPISAEWIFPGEYQARWGYENATRLLDRFTPETRPTAVFAFCDAIALGALDAFADRGVRVPEDLSVVGFDDVPLAESRGLTTVHHPIREVGRQAVETLLARVSGDAPPDVCRLVPGQLVVRASVAAPPEREYAR